MKFERVVFFACLAVFVGACASPRDEGGAPPIVADAGGGQVSPDGPPSVSPDGPTTPVALDAAPVDCSSGTHRCGDRCLDNKSVDGCGASCQACPAIKGGVPACDGTMCGGACPDGQKLCHGECIAASASCTGACQPGFHDCQGVCADDKSVNSCGPSACTPCTAPPGGTPTCDSGRCDFGCGALKRCADVCGACCTNADCPAPAGQMGTCDPATHTCKTGCATGSRDCGGGRCVPMANGCCSDGDCGTCKKCSAGVCVNQGSGEDVKDECPSIDCHTGSCNGQGACGVDPNGSNGHNCDGSCRSCQNGSCANKSGTTVCSPRTCFNGNVAEGRCAGGGCSMQTVQTCNATQTCTGSSCVAVCGDEGKPCCPSGANAGCASTLFCDDSATCRQKLPVNTPCSDRFFMNRDDWCKTNYCGRSGFCNPCGHVGENCCTSGAANCMTGFCNNNCPKNMLSPNDKDSQCEAIAPDPALMCLIF